MKGQLSVAILQFALCSCTVIAPLPHYESSESIPVATHITDLKNVALGQFVSEINIDPYCRGGWWKISPGGEETFERYIRDALADELRVVIEDGGVRPRVLLTGHVERLQFSSILTWLRSGYWDIRLRVDSSNGRTLTVEQKTAFETGYHDVPACKKVAAQFPVAVRALIGALVSSTDFPLLLE